MSVDLTRILLAAIMVVIAIGCETQSTSNTSTKQSHDTAGANKTPSEDGVARAQYQPSVTAADILSAVVHRYQTAKTYQDKAILHLSYVLNGEPLDEPKRWSTIYQNDGRISLQLFNAKVHGNGDVLACEVFDIQTANLDNQNLVIPYPQPAAVPPLATALKDQIARQFLLGFSEIPLESSYEKLGPWLLPPPAAMLTGQVTNPWLQSPQKSKRLADQNIDQKNCFVVRSQAQGLSADIWIDQQSLAILQISLPLKLLADEVIASPEVRDVALVAKFHGAIFDRPVESSVFEFQPRSEAVLVRKVVSLPEPLPCELIGRKVPDIVLVTPQGTARRRDFFKNKTNVLVWLAGPQSIDTVKQMVAMTTSAPQTVDYGIVFTDSDSAIPGSGRPVPSPAVAELGQRLNVPVYFDRQHTTSSQLKIKAVPAAIVIDAQTRVQYALPLTGDDWSEKLTAATQRVQRGDDVAGEMRESYAQYLDTYHQQLTAVSAEGLLANMATESTGTPEAASGQSSIKQTGRDQPAGGTLKIAPERIWTNKDFKSPGNIVAINSGNGSPVRFALFDGVQSIVLIDADGNPIKTVRPADLAATNSITTFAVSHTSNSTPLVCYSVLGEKYWLLDQDLNTIDVRKAAQTSAPAGILDIRFDEKKTPFDLLVATEEQGLRSYGLQGHHGESSPKGQLITDARFDSIACSSNTVVGVSAGKLTSATTNQAVVQDEIQFVRVAATAEQFVGVGQNEHGKWSAIGFDNSLQRQWAIETGPHLHENFLSPIASCTFETGLTIWAIADSQQTVHLVTGGGRWLGEFQADGNITGLAIAKHQDRTRLLISVPDGVECWQLNVR